MPVAASSWLTPLTIWAKKGSPKTRSSLSSATSAIVSVRRVISERAAAFGT
jgi:hypothetical protein